MKKRFRKSIKITKGIRLNLNKNSTSVTLGKGPLKHTFNSKGRVSRSISLPHTGVYYTETIKNEKASFEDDEKFEKYLTLLYKIASVTCIIGGIIVMLGGILLLFAIPIVGIFAIGFGIAFVSIGKKYSKKAKELQ